MMQSGVGRICVTAGLIVLLTACGAQSLVQGSPPVLQTDASALSSPDASGQNFLYVSSIEGSKVNVLIYTYPKGRYKEDVQKAGLVFPHGECADKRGHVYVTNESSDSSSSEVLEYAHGGTAPIRTLSVSGPADQCAVDAITGDLAVASSDLAIFRAAHGKPTYHAFPTGFEHAACDYDDKGNLFVDGVMKRVPSRAALAELPARSRDFVKVKMPDISEAKVPGDVRWDGKDLALGDGVNSIYRLAVSGAKAQVVGIVQLYGGSDVESMWIEDGDIVGANNSSRTVMIWAYPAGGQPIRVLNSVGRGDGVAVSDALKRK